MKMAYLLVVVLVAASGTVLGESPRDSHEPARPEETDLYGMFLDKWTGGGAQVIHIARIAEAPPPKAMAEYATCLKGSRLAGLANPATPLQLSETSLARRSNTRLVDPKKWRPRDPGTAIANGKPTSKAVSDGFAAGLLTFSRMIFDEQHTVAVFTYSFTCSDLCGGGGGVMFDKTASGSKQREMPCGGWVS